MARTIAIGDIHGCATALLRLVEQINPQPEDILVPIGDYVDRGPDSRRVMVRLIELSTECHLVPILGNHDEMMLRARDSQSELQFWLRFGGEATLDCYRPTGQMDSIPDAHFDFLKSCVPYFETETHIFTHANFKPDVPFDRQDGHTMRWLSLREYQPSARHCSGKTVIVGHTPQKEILHQGFMMCIDTGCCNGGWLSAIDIESGDTWQVNNRGEARS